jgi:hypothetical protein
MTAAMKYRVLIGQPVASYVVAPLAATWNVATNT